MRTGRDLGEGAQEKHRAYLVAKALRGDNCDFIANTLVGLKVKGEFWVVAFDDDFGRLLDGLWRAKLVFRETFKIVTVSIRRSSPLFGRDPSCRLWVRENESLQL